MIGIFKQKNPGNALVLLLYALALKFPFFLHPEKYIVNEGDNYIFNIIVKFLAPLTANGSPLIFTILAFILLLVWHIAIKYFLTITLY